MKWLTQGHTTIKLWITDSNLVRIEIEIVVQHVSLHTYTHLLYRI